LGVRQQGSILWPIPSNEQDEIYPPARAYDWLPLLRFENYQGESFSTYNAAA